MYENMYKAIMMLGHSQIYVDLDEWNNSSKFKLTPLSEVGR